MDSFAYKFEQTFIERETRLFGNENVIASAVRRVVEFPQMNLNSQGKQKLCLVFNMSSVSE